MNRIRSVRGVYYDLKQSKYVFTVGGIKFYFSSVLYRDKFMDRYLDECERFHEAINKIYKDKFDIRASTLALVRLYTLIEKRGFYIKVNGVGIDCLENLIFDMTVS